uniref:hypothetical protein n=1 Tax=uncultured Polaribacter sp. TaxID=174711 RepID=UPI00261D5E62|nr:hypothetical protein [uncultured Polaribacter sp.]
MKKETYNSNITKDDKQALREKKENIRFDAADDVILQERKTPVDFTGKDLDVPGRDLPSKTNKKNYKDEENQLYSLGSEENENLEQDTI